jgi:hypothetical protein
MTEPGGEITAGAGGRGHLRASDSEREQVIGLLQTAFVQERLTKDEFDARVGRTLTSRTRAELAALSADIPAALMAAPPLRRPAESGSGKAAAAVLGSIAVWWGTILAASWWVRDNAAAQRSMGVAVGLVVLHLSIVSIWLVAVLLSRRASKRSARGPSPGGGDQAARIAGPLGCR